MFSKTGWLVMAAALTMGMASCSSDENMIEEQPEQPTAKNLFHVTVGAGIDNGTMTRATVDDSETDGNGKTLRTLKFTEGDQLYVMGESEIGGYHYDMNGLLSIGNITGDGTQASFSGDLTAFHYDPEAPDNPEITTLEHFIARLVAYNNGGSIYGLPEQCSYQEGITATETLNEAIARHSYVEGEIDASANVTLTAKSAFLNCAISGLTAGDTYEVKMADHMDQPVSVTADAEGKLNFVAWLLTGEVNDLTILIGDDKYANLGSKTLAAKVYNVTRAAQNITPLTVIDDETGQAVEKVEGIYHLTWGGHYTVSGVGSGTIYCNGSTLTIENGTNLMGGIRYEGNEANIILNGDATVTSLHSPSSTSAYFAISGSGTLTATKDLACTNIRLASGVTLRCTEDAFVFAAVWNASGTDIITPATEGGYKVYVGSGSVSGSGGGAVITVLVNQGIIGDGGLYVVYDNDENHYELTATGDTYNSDYGETYIYYTAPLAAGATTYTVWNPWGFPLAENVAVSGGELMIYEYSDWGYKNW